MSPFYCIEYITLPGKATIAIKRFYLEVGFIKAFNIDFLLSQALCDFHCKHVLPELKSGGTKIRLICYSYNEERSNYKFVSELRRRLAFKRFNKEND